MKNKDDFLAPENDASLPFSERELAQRQVEREERQARVEMGSKAKEASGFHQVAFPLTADAEQAIRDMANGLHSWVQLVRNSLCLSLAHFPATSPWTRASRTLKCATRNHQTA